jgi:hypothetical protein
VWEGEGGGKGDKAGVGGKGVMSRHTLVGTKCTLQDTAEGEHAYCAP